MRPFDYMMKAGQLARQKVFPGRYATRKICKARVDFRSGRSTSKWSGTAQQVTRNGHSQHSVPSAVQAPIYSSGPDTVSATLKEKKMRFMMIHYPKVYATAKPGWVPDFKEMEEMGKYNDELGKAGVLLALDESHRRPVSRNEGSDRRLLDYSGEVARRGARMGLAHPRKR